MSSKVHRIRFYNPEPQPINCLAYNHIKKYVAIARKNASIEIWDLNYAPLLIIFIPGSENGSIEAMTWSNNRLFSTGLGGALVEWDLQTLSVKSVLLTGYAAWCLDVNASNSTIAVGTEQGYLNLFSIDDNDIVYKSLFDKQDGRILCCKFDKTGNILVTGSIDTIRIWNVQTGHAINRLSASRRGKEVIVWCLSILSDNTVVSGDSLGRLTFWDSALGEQIESFTTHKADILTLAVSDDEKSLYCSGVDPAVINFIKVDMNNKLGFQWVKNVQRNVHEHDVRALCFHGKTLLSAGVDGYLTLSSFPPKWVMRVPPMLPGRTSCISVKKKLLLLKYDNRIDIWKLGSYATNKGKPMFGENKPNNNMESDKKGNKMEQDSGNLESCKKGQPLKIQNKPVKLASITTTKNRSLKCCAMSPDGKLILYSTDSLIRILKLQTDEEDDRNVSISKVSMCSLPTSSCEEVTFSPDSTTAVLAHSGSLYILLIDSATGASLQQTIDTHKYLKTSTILHLSLSQRCASGRSYLVAADTSGSICIWYKTDRQPYQLYVSLPNYQCIPSALLVDARHETFVATYVDQKVIEYDLDKKKYLNCCSSKLGERWANRKSAITAIHTHPYKTDTIIFQDINSLWVLDKKNSRQQENFEPQAKVRNWNAQNFDFKVIPIKYLTGFHWLDNDEAVLVELLPENIVAQLPPTIETKRYNA